MFRDSAAIENNGASASVPQETANPTPVEEPKQESGFEKLEDKLEEIGEEIKEEVKEVIEEVKEFIEGDDAPETEE